MTIQHCHRLPKVSWASWRPSLGRLLLTQGAADLAHSPGCKVEHLGSFQKPRCPRALGERHQDLGGIQTPARLQIQLIKCAVEVVQPWSSVAAAQGKSLRSSSMNPRKEGWCILVPKAPGDRWGSGWWVMPAGPLSQPGLLSRGSCQTCLWATEG